MKTMKRTWGRAVATLALAGAVATLPGHASDVPNVPAATVPASTPRSFVTRHSGMFGGKRIAYEARVEEMILRDGKGRATASLFSTSYIAAPVKGGDRPILFVFNGGPGASSVWLHMGAMGPRRVSFRDEVHPDTVPPFRIADNPDCPLDVTDIVFFDPPNTGFSRILPDGKDEDFLGVQQDARTTVEFITRWINDHQRWNSPRYMLGESYGTVRAAVAARMLVGGPATTGHLEAMTLNGVLLLGQAMGSGSSNVGDDRRYAEILPTLAATAWYHNRIDRRGRSLEDVFAEAQTFAAGEYWTALYAGSALPTADRDRIAGRIHDLTGIARDEILADDLRIDGAAALDLMLSDKGLQIGLYDSRFTLPLGNRAGDPVADDPAMAQYVPGYMGAFNVYLRDELKVTLPDIYRGIEWASVNKAWDWGDGPGRKPSREYATDMAIAMRRNPALRLFVGTGYYDVVTSIGTAEQLIRHAGIPLSATTFHDYPSGHMVYVGENSRRRFAQDVRAFLTVP